MDNLRSVSVTVLTLYTQTLFFIYTINNINHNNNYYNNINVVCVVYNTVRVHNTSTYYLQLNYISTCVCIRACGYMSNACVSVCTEGTRVVCVCVCVCVDVRSVCVWLFAILRSEYMQLFRCGR